MQTFVSDCTADINYSPKRLHAQITHLAVCCILIMTSKTTNFFFIFPIPQPTHKYNISQSGCARLFSTKKKMATTFTEVTYLLNNGLRDRFSIVLVTLLHCLRKTESDNQISTYSVIQFHSSLYVKNIVRNITLVE